METGNVRIGIVGVGNCASSLVQGLVYYRDADGNEPVPGLMNLDLGGYHVRDVEVACAFDVAKGKVGNDVAEAIAAAQQHPPLCRRSADRAFASIADRRSTASARYLRDEVEESPEPVSDVADVPARSRHGRAGLLSAGRLAEGDRVRYAEQALEAGLRLRQLHPGLHRLAPAMAQALRRSADCR